jgi:hypothetical protein
MGTRVRLNDAFLDEAKREARRKGRRPDFTAKRPKVVLPVSKSRGGVLPGVDLSNNTSLHDVIEEDLPFDKFR